MSTGPVPTISLRTNFVWTLAGNAVYATGQWAILSLISKMGGDEMLGEYALAMAVTAPVLMFAHLNLRSVVATDLTPKHAFGDYLTVRLLASAAGLCAVGVMTRFAALPGVIVALAVGQSAETVSDAFYGLLQRQERMRRIAMSMMARAALSVLALAGALWWSGDLLVAMAALACARLVALGWDASVGWRWGSLRAAPRILRTALPLGVVLMLVTLNSNLPRYAIERHLGTRELGAFAAVASFMTAGNTVINALGQSATPRLARHFVDSDARGFRRLLWRLAGIAVALGAAGIGGAWLVGGPLLRAVYRPEFGQYAGLLIAMMAAAVPVYVASTLGYAITSVRAFDVQLPLFAVVAASCAGASWWLVPRVGLMGAAAALGVAGCVQIAGELGILSRTMRLRAEPRP